MSGRWIDSARALVGLDHPETANPSPKRASKKGVPVAKAHNPGNDFQILPTEFEITLRGKEKGTKKTVTEPALYLQGKLYSENVAPPLPTIKTSKTRHIRIADLRTVANMVHSRYSEETAHAVLAAVVSGELPGIVTSLGISILDFIAWVARTLESLPKPERVSRAKAKPTRNLDAERLAGLLSSIPNMDPSAALDEVQRILGSEVAVSGALSLLGSWLEKNGRDKNGYIRQRVRTK